MSTTTATVVSKTEANRRRGKLDTRNAEFDQDSKIRYSHRLAKPYKEEDLKQFKVPDLTIKELLASIPAHCFERSALRSSYYVLIDFAMIAALAYMATFINPTITSPFARYCLWFVYSVLQGFVFTGVWILAHECGHQSFSTSKRINNTVGLILHSALLVPYHAWRISHARHHAATGHLTRDEVYVPRTREQAKRLELRPSNNTIDARIGSDETFSEWLQETLDDAPLYNLYRIIKQQLFGWPAYLIDNASGQLSFPKNTNHFNPNSFIFEERHRSQIILSDVGLIVVITALLAWGLLSPGGFKQVFLYYGAPYLWTNHWLVMITYLQHTDPVVPHYSADMWTFPRGALCTVDRKWLGPVGPYLMHGLAETHVLHHLCSKIPHYHAWEASEAIKKKLGQHYQSSDENVFISLWKNMNKCKYVNEEDKICFYRDCNGVPSACLAQESRANSDSAIALSD